MIESIKRNKWKTIIHFENREPIEFLLLNFRHWTTLPYDVFTVSRSKALFEHKHEQRSMQSSAAANILKATCDIQSDTHSRLKSRRLNEDKYFAEIVFAGKHIELLFYGMDECTFIARAMPTFQLSRFMRAERGLAAHSNLLYCNYTYFPFSPRILDNCHNAPPWTCILYPSKSRFLCEIYSTCGSAPHSSKMVNLCSSFFSIILNWRPIWCAPLTEEWK